MALQRIFIQPGNTRVLRLLSRFSGFAVANARFASTAPATVVDAGFWKSLVPKPLRRENREQRKAKATREWNPATFFVVIFLFIGSMSIQMIALRNQFQAYMRQSEVRIAQLREVVERIQNGEQVDVQKALGTGDAKREADWEEMLKAIEQDERSRKAQRKTKQAELQKKREIAEAEARDSEPEASPSKPKAPKMGNFF